MHNNNDELTLFQKIDDHISYARSVVVHGNLREIGTMTTEGGLLGTNRTIPGVLQLPHDRSEMNWLMPSTMDK